MLTHEESKGRVWQLLYGSEVVTEIVQTAYEFPWTYGAVTDVERFNVLRPYFHDAADWPESPDFAAFVEQVRRTGLTLLDTRNQTVFHSFTLNAEQDTGSATVWFRETTVEAIAAESDTDGTWTAVLHECPFDDLMTPGQ